MKLKIAIILTMLLSVPAFGGQWLSDSDRAKLKAGTFGIVWHETEAKCKIAFPGEDCFNCVEKDCRFQDKQTTNVDDTTKPIYKPKYNIENCDSDADCQTKQGSKNDCTSGDYTAYEKNSPPIPGYSLYCIGISGYEQKEVKVLVENAAEKTSVEAADAAKAQLRADIGAMKAHIKFGNRMIAYIGARNMAKSLTTAQVKTVVETYSTIQALLASGSIATAKVEIEAVTPDGTLITQADKDAILAEVNAYLGQ